MTIRNALINARKEKGMTQQILAEQVGIDRAFLANIERGKYNPSLKVANDIANALGKDIQHLFFEPNVRKTDRKKAK